MLKFFVSLFLITSFASYSIHFVEALPQGGVKIGKESKKNSDKMSQISYGVAAAFLGSAAACFASGCSRYYMALAGLAAGYGMMARKDGRQSDRLIQDLSFLHPSSTFQAPSIGQELCEGSSKCKTIYNRLAQQEPAPNAKICFGKAKNTPPCIQLDENENPVHVVLKKDETPVSFSDLENKVKSYSKIPYIKKTQARLNKIQDRIAKNLLDLDAKEKATSLASDESSRAGDDLQEEPLGDGSNISGSNVNGRTLSSLESKKKNPWKNLFAQFKTKKDAKKLASKSVHLEQDEVGVSQDNIFLMVHRRYKERTKAKQFIIPFSLKTSRNPELLL